MKSTLINVFVYLACGIVFLIQENWAAAFMALGAILGWIHSYLLELKNERHARRATD